MKPPMKIFCVRHWVRCKVSVRKICWAYFPIAVRGRSSNINPVGAEFEFSKCWLIPNLGQYRRQSGWSLHISQSGFFSTSPLLMFMYTTDWWLGMIQQLSDATQAVVWGRTWRRSRACEAGGIQGVKIYKWQGDFSHKATNTCFESFRFSKLGLVFNTSFNILKCR